MKIIITLTIIIFALLNTAMADRCDSTETDENTSTFPLTFNASKVLAKELCKQKIEPTIDNSVAIQAKANIWKNAALNEVLFLKEAGIDLTDIIQAIHTEVLNGEPFIRLEAVRSPSKFFKASNGDIIPIDDNNSCKVLAQGLTCFQVIDQLSKTTKTINSSVNVETLEQTYEKLGLYSKAWDDYFTKARSQTFLELSVNTALYKDELQKGENVLPPNYQAILFHPTVAIEYVKDAKDGEQQKDALVMEWIGINFWNARIPWGASIISSYSDRQSVQDNAWGVMLHVNNNYSIAYTKHDDSSGILLTVDLLKLFEDKGSNLENYKTKIEKYIK
jgi:hypothetical protein